MDDLVFLIWLFNTDVGVCGDKMGDVDINLSGTLCADMGNRSLIVHTPSDMKFDCDRCTVATQCDIYNTRCKLDKHLQANYSRMLMKISKRSNYIWGLSEYMISHMANQVGLTYDGCMVMIGDLPILYPNHWFYYIDRVHLHPRLLCKDEIIDNDDICVNDMVRYGRNCEELLTILIHNLNGMSVPYNVIKSYLKY